MDSSGGCITSSDIISSLTLQLSCIKTPARANMKTSMCLPGGSSVLLGIFSEGSPYVLSDIPSENRTPLCHELRGVNSEFQCYLHSIQLLPSFSFLDLVLYILESLQLEYNNLLAVYFNSYIYI